MTLKTEKLSYKASTTGRYDALISSYFAGEVGDKYPDILNLTFQKNNFKIWRKSTSKWFSYIHTVKCKNQSKLWAIRR